MPDLTAHDLYELVKGLPEEARPAGFSFYDLSGYTPACEEYDGTVDHLVFGESEGDLYGEPAMSTAILLHEASVMRWLAETMGSVSISSEFDADGEYVVEYVLPERRVECSSCDGYATGPTLLHALVAAAEGVG